MEQRKSALMMIVVESKLLKILYIHKAPQRLYGITSTLGELRFACSISREINFGNLEIEKLSFNIVINAFSISTNLNGKASMPTYIYYSTMYGTQANLGF